MLTMIQNDILLHEIFMCKEVYFNQLKKKKKNSNNYKLTFKLFKYNFV